MTLARNLQAGVTLIEMLVVLALVGVLAGIMALSVPRGDAGASVETTALALAANLRRAVKYARDHQVGFGVQIEPDGYRLLEESADVWVQHTDPGLNKLKLFPDGMRIESYDQETAIYGVTRYLEPISATVWKLRIGQGFGARVVTFDGVEPQITSFEGD